MSCGCGKGTINGKMQAGGGDSMQVFAKIGGAVIAGTLAYKGGEMITEHVEYLKNNTLVSGLVKGGGAVLAAVLMPDIVANEWGTGALVGLGISGGQDLLKYAGVNGIGFINEPKYLNPNAYNKTAKTVGETNAGVKVQYT